MGDFGVWLFGAFVGAEITVAVLLPVLLDYPSKPAPPPSKPPLRISLRFSWDRSLPAIGSDFCYCDHWYKVVRHGEGADGKYIEITRDPDLAPEAHSEMLHRNGIRLP